jgi:predicted transcriptional regulator
MTAKKRTSRKRKTSGTDRASISFPHELYRTLEEIADRKKVSIAWVVREAVEQYVAGQWPLFGKQ